MNFSLDVSSHHFILLGDDCFYTTVGSILIKSISFLFQIYIQNELCEGGSLQKQIETFRQTGARFSEAELKRLIVHVAKVK